jgi:hypothetical protein
MNFARRALLCFSFYLASASELAAKNNKREIFHVPLAARLDELFYCSCLSSDLGARYFTSPPQVVTCALTASAEKRQFEITPPL